MAARLLRRALRSCAFCALAGLALAQTKPLRRHKIGLVLEGGGALGFAHIGVIQYLEEHHIPIDLVLGTNYRPLSRKSSLFYAPHIYAISSPFNLYAAQAKLSEYRIDREGFGFDLGYTFSPRGELRIGQDLLWYRTRKVIISDQYPDTTERDGVTHVKFRYLGVDNAELPRQGLYLQFTTGRYERDESFVNFTQTELGASYFRPVSKSGSLLFTAPGGTTYGAPTNSILLQGFSLGGPFRLGAYGLNELVGNQYFLFQSGYEHKLLPFSPLVGEGLYAIGLLETGKMYDSLNPTPGLPFDGSFALAARTALGPIFLGGGIGAASHRKWWFGVGHIF